MSRRHDSIEALVKPDSGGEQSLCVSSPGVGIMSRTPRLGEIVVEGSLAGHLTTLGQTVNVVIPASVTGRIAERHLTHKREPVAYGQPLLRLVPVQEAEVGRGVEGGTIAVSGLPEGTFAVVSPTHGMFYRRPTPDSPPYVEPGQIVERGATLALVEVMKCFSAITYGSEGHPPRAEVVEVRADDTTEVATDQVLFVLREA